MAEAKEPGPVLFFTGILAADEDCLAYTIDRLTREWGDTCARSPSWPFANSGYYRTQTGGNILRAFCAFAGGFRREELARRKLEANRIEQELARELASPLPRPVNIDPGYLAPEKLVLASCKNFAHRIYIGEGVFAEVTLLYRGGRFVPREWTFPDFADTAYHPFFYGLRAEMMRDWY